MYKIRNIKTGKEYEYFPAGHLIHDNEFAVEYVPLGHV